MNLFLAIMWTIIMVMDIIACATGGSPTWGSVFCPLVVLVVDYWIKWFESRLK